MVGECVHQAKPRQARPHIVNKTEGEENKKTRREENKNNKKKTCHKSDRISTFPTVDRRIEPKDRIDRYQNSDSIFDGYETHINGRKCFRKNKKNGRMVFS